jgi:hypothetical protein
VADQRGVVRSGGVNIGAYQASASAFVITVPGTVAAGTPFDVTVQAVDLFGQVAFGYRGTVTFRVTDPDPAVVLPADYTFTADDQGVAHIQRRLYLDDARHLDAHRRRSGRCAKYGCANHGESLNQLCTTVLRTVLSKQDGLQYRITWPPGFET